MGMWQVLNECNTGDKAYEAVVAASNATAKSKQQPTFMLQLLCCAKEPLVTCHFSDKTSIIPCKDSPKIDPGGKPFW